MTRYNVGDILVDICRAHYYRVVKINMGSVRVSKMQRRAILDPLTEKYVPDTTGLLEHSISCRKGQHGLRGSSGLTRICLIQWDGQPREDEWTFDQHAA